MRKWTETQQQQLDGLNAAKAFAEGRLRDDVDTLLDQTAGGIGGPVSDYLLAYGQQVLDMLLVHFEPSPQALKVDDPAHWQSFESAVKRG